MEPTRPFAALAAAGAVLLLAGCATAQAPQRTVSTAAATASAAAGDVCALVPTTALKKAVKADPGAGVPSKGRIDGGQCTWKISATHTVLVQVTKQPDAYLPSTVYKQPVDAHRIDGVDRGWVSAAGHSLLVVKNGTGVLLTDIEFRTVSQKRFDALAEAIAARL